MIGNKNICLFVEYANHISWYIAVIVVFSKSRDKCLKKSQNGSQIIGSKAKSCCNGV